MHGRRAMGKQSEKVETGQGKRVRRNQPCLHLDLDLQPQNSDKINVLLSHPVGSILLLQL